MDDYFDFEAFKTTHSLTHSQRRIEKTTYNDLVTWAGPAAVYSSFIGISLTTNEW
jgi:hypothetical protein